MNIEDFEPPKMTDKELIKSLPCMICGQYGVDAHHVPSRGAGGKDMIEDMVPLCRAHHTEIHKVGILSFAYKHKDFMNWLRANKPYVLLKNLL